jgi:1,4-alpha-glucan branching enzyme
MVTHPGKKMLFMGGEFGQWIEWNSNQSLDWHLLDYEPHRKLRELVRDLNRLYRLEPALHQVDFEWRGFEWVDFQDVENSVIAFLRRARDPHDYLLVVCNFTPVPRPHYRVGVPRPGFHRELITTNALDYGGSGVTNQPGCPAEARPWHNQPCSLELNLPPLSVTVLKPQH